MTFSGVCDAISRRDQSRATGQSLALASQVGAQVVGVVLRGEDLDHNAPKAHEARDQELAYQIFLEALVPS